jgi:transporter family-2 protein
MSIIPYVLVFLTGLMNAIHSGTNAQLTHSLGRPWWAGVFVCLISAALLLVGVGATREAFPSLTSLAATPWWAWVGTAIAAIPVISTLFFAGRLGGAAFNGLVVTGTILFSILLDHYGLLGFRTHHVNLQRIAGAVLMMSGLILICIF